MSNRLKLATPWKEHFVQAKSRMRLLDNQILMKRGQIAVLQEETNDLQRARQDWEGHMSQLMTLLLQEAGMDPTEQEYVLSDDGTEIVSTGKPTTIQG